MDTLITEWIKRLDDWVINTSSIIFLILISIVAIMIGVAVKRYTDAISRENKLIELQDNAINLNNEVILHKNKHYQLQNVLINVRSYINSLNHLAREKDMNHIYLIQRIIEAIASDIKLSGFERHRCGFWLYEEEISALKLVNGSSGFPDTYINARLLDVNDSIAGRAFRKNQVLNLSNVTTDGDWTASESSGSYKALICIPIVEYGVLTIDAKEPMDESIQLIGELYATIIEGIFDILLRKVEQEVYSDKNNDDLIKEAAYTDEI